MAGPRGLLEQDAGDVDNPRAVAAQRPHGDRRERPVRRQAQGSHVTCFRETCSCLHLRKYPPRNWTV